LKTAFEKVESELTFNELFGRAVLGNLCVCIAVWVSMAGRSVTDKVVAMILPLSALGALQLEHIVATFYYMPRTILLAWFRPEFIPEGVSVPGVLDFLRVAVPVIKISENHCPPWRSPCIPPMGGCPRPGSEKAFASEHATGNFENLMTHGIT